MKAPLEFKPDIIKSSKYDISTLTVIPTLYVVFGGDVPRGRQKGLEVSMPNDQACLQAEKQQENQ